MAVAFRLFLVALVALVGASLSACAAGPAVGPLSEAELLSDRVVPEYRLGPRRLAPRPAHQPRG